jgi:prepilin-type N-terminal cleavage/methylation domain-containing protein
MFSQHKEDHIKHRSRGFSLLELLVSISIMVLLAAFTLSSIRTYNMVDINSVIEEAARRVKMRRMEAVRLAAMVGEGSINRADVQPPLVIEFNNNDGIDRTRQLRLSGPNTNDLTHLMCPPDEPLPLSGRCPGGDDPYWFYQYQGLPLKLQGWKVATAQSDLGTIPVISNSTLTTKIEFTYQGRVLPADPNSIGTASVWAIYFINSNNDARALTVHETGYVEMWSWNKEKSKWIGFGNREDVSPTP